jgi:hypothetical protein
MADDYSEGRLTDQTWHEPHGSTLGTLLIVLVLDAGIVGLFMLITWAAYYTD